MLMAETLKHNLRVEPYDYQKEGILAGLRWHRFLIGDEPGLGKTLQSIGVVDCANAYPCLVICPSSLKINWQREFEKFTNKKALVLDNSVLTTWPYLLRMGMQQVAVVNYESLRKYFVWDIKGGSRGGFRLKDVVFTPDINIFMSIIIDESHRVKDPSAQQTIFARGIAEGKEIGLAEGEAIGLVKGEAEHKLKVAKLMLAKGCYSLQEITELSGLSLADVEKLKEEA